MDIAQPETSVLLRSKAWMPAKRPSEERHEQTWCVHRPSCPRLFAIVAPSQSLPARLPLSSFPLRPVGNAAVCSQDSLVTSVSLGPGHLVVASAEREPSPQECPCATVCVRVHVNTLTRSLAQIHANCSSAVLCLPMWFLSELNFLRLFVVYVNHPKPKPESGSASALMEEPLEQDIGKPGCFCVAVANFFRQNFHQKSSFIEKKQKKAPSAPVSQKGKGGVLQSIQVKCVELAAIYSNTKRTVARLSLYIYVYMYIAELDHSCYNQNN